MMDCILGLLQGNRRRISRRKKFTKLDSSDSSTNNNVKYGDIQIYEGEVVEGEEEETNEPLSLTSKLTKKDLIIQRENREIFSNNIESTVSKITKKEQYLLELIFEKKKEIDNLENNKNDEIIKRKKQINCLKIIKIYENQRFKLIDLKHTLDTLKISVDGAQDLAQIQKILFQGSKVLKTYNDKMDKINIEEITNNILSSLENINEIQNTITTINCEGENNDDDQDLDAELERLIKGGSDQKYDVGSARTSDPRFARTSSGLCPDDTNKANNSDMPELAMLTKQNNYETEENSKHIKHQGPHNISNPPPPPTNEENTIPIEGIEKKFKKKSNQPNNAPFINNNKKEAQIAKKLLTS
jgi:hypothetical protein